MSVDPEDLDLYAQVRTAARSQAKHLIRRLEEAASGGGKRTIQHACSACGTRDSIEVEMLDLKDARDQLALFRAFEADYAKQAASTADTTSVRARATLEELRDMSDEELAEYVVRLGSDAAPEG